MAYPSCQQKQLKEIIDCLGNKHSFQDKPLSHCDRQFLERCQGQLKKYVGPLAFVLLERAMKFYRSDNRTIFLEEIAVQVSSHTKSQALAQAFYCEILSLDDEKTND
jgi:predicted nucleic acid-binding Zn ribbon protein